MSGMVDDLIQKYGIESIPSIMDKIKEFGFKYATTSGTTWSIDDVTIPANKYEIIEKAKEKVALIQEQFDAGLLSQNEKRAKNIEKWTEAKEEVQKSMQAE
jgi:DNA-directed RNA polymerase subunit beta'